MRRRRNDARGLGHDADPREAEQHDESAESPWLRTISRVPDRAPSVSHDTIREMAGPGPTIQDPRGGTQLVVLPVLLLVVFLLAPT